MDYENVCRNGKKNLTNTKDPRKTPEKVGKSKSRIDEKKYLNFAGRVTKISVGSPGMHGGFNLG